MVGVKESLGTVLVCRVRMGDGEAPPYRFALADIRRWRSSRAGKVTGRWCDSDCR